MRDGFVRVAVGTPEIRVADCDGNAKSIIALMRQADARQAKLLTLPELCITGYTAADLFLTRPLLNGALEAHTRRFGRAGRARLRGAAAGAGGQAVQLRGVRQGRARAGRGAQAQFAELRRLL